MRSLFYDSRHCHIKEFHAPSSDPDGNIPPLQAIGTSGTTLMMAAVKGRNEIVNMLLEAGADVALKSSCVLPFLSPA